MRYWNPKDDKASAVEAPCTTRTAAAGRQRRKKVVRATASGHCTRPTGETERALSRLAMTGGALRTDLRLDSHLEHQLELLDPPAIMAVSSSPSVAQLTSACTGKRAQRERERAQRSVLWVARDELLLQEVLARLDVLGLQREAALLRNVEPAVMDGQTRGRSG